MYLKYIPRFVEFVIVGREAGFELFKFDEFPVFLAASFPQ